MLMIMIMIIIINTIFILTGEGLIYGKLIC